MNNDVEKLIDSLSKDLSTTRQPMNVARASLLWLLISGAYVVAVIHATGPIRPGAWQQLVTEPRFFLESLLGLFAIAFCGLAAFRASIPGALTRRFLVTTIVVVTVWISQYVFGLISPALEPSMLGKRHGCVFETFAYALPPIIAGFFIVRRRYPLDPVGTAFGFSLAAGMMPALYMQIACMYAPAHILQFHIMPALALGALSAGLTWLIRAAR